jgi:hypothetical protein|uniref:Uncharacterized protein n=1 Tax=viral metagenome TaxID=1070528 RepID=A0A6C0CZZ5_9ZZZZ
MIIYHYFRENGLFNGTTITAKDIPLPPNSTLIQVPVLYGKQKAVWNNINNNWSIITI